MQKKALIVIDIQNDITKNYKNIIGNINNAIDWAIDKNINIVYIRHENLSAGTRTFKPNTIGAQLVPDLKIASTCITSYDKRKIEEMLNYYLKIGCNIEVNPKD